MSEENYNMERRVRAQCGWQTGWFNPDDAIALAKQHTESCGECGSIADLEYKEREKTGQNYSDTIVDLGPPKECPNCSADNIQSQLHCAVCGEVMIDV